MRLHFATVPIHDDGEAEAELNRFLASHRILAIDRQLVVDGSRSAWAICVTYLLPGSSRPEPGGSVNATAASPGGRADLLRHPPVDA